MAAIGQKSELRRSKRGAGREKNQENEPEAKKQKNILSSTNRRKTCDDCTCDHHDEDDVAGHDHRHYKQESPLSSPRSVNAVGNHGSPSQSTTPEQHHGTPEVEGYQQVLFVDQVADLIKIQDDDVQLAVWRPESAPEFATALSNPSVSPEDLPNFEGMVLPEEGLVAHIMKRHLWVPYKLRSHEKRKKALDEKGMDQLIDQVEQLVLLFANITKDAGFLDEDDDSQLPFVYVKLKVVEDNGCVFWHQDCVPFRLVSTYRGPCTEWVPPAFSKETLERRKMNSKHARSLAPCDVALFKGRGDTEEGDELLDQPGIVHRSPRIEGSGNYRVVLVLDIPQEGWHF